MDNNKMTALNEMELANVNGGFVTLLCTGIAIAISSVLGATVYGIYFSKEVND